MTEHTYEVSAAVRPRGTGAMGRIASLARRRGEDERGMTLIEVILALLICSIILIPVMAWSVLAITSANDDSVTSSTRSTALLNRYLKADVASSIIGSEIDPTDTHTCTPKLQSPGGTDGKVVLWLLNGDRTTLITYTLVETDKIDADTGDQISRLVRRQCPWTVTPATDDDPNAGVQNDVTPPTVTVAEYLTPDRSALGGTGEPVYVQCSPREGNDDNEDPCGEVTMSLWTPTGSVVVKATRRIDPPIDWNSTRKPIAVIKCDPACPADGTRRFTVAFDSMGSYDPDGINGVAWDFGDGSVSSERNPVHTYSNIGTSSFKTFNVKLTVVNELGTFSTARTTVTVRNARPVPVASPSVVVGNRIDYVPFDGSGSVDPDEGATPGDITFRWDYGDGTSYNGVKEPGGHRYNVVLDHFCPYGGAQVRCYQTTATLTMTDANNDSESVSVPVTILNKLPIACFSTNQTSPVAPSPNPGACQQNPIPNPPKEIRTDVYPITITFDSNSVGAPESRDDDGFIAARIWKVGTGANAPTQRGTGNSLTQSFSFGLHTVILEVVDNDGARSSYAIQVNVNQKPVGKIGAGPVGPGGPGGPGGGPGGPGDPSPCRFNTRPATCAFSAADSTDADGSIVGWLWDFDDGTTSTEMAPTHTWTEYGTYEVTLVVTDDVGSNSVPVSIIVKVNEGPTPVIGPASLNAKRKKSFQFDSSGSQDDVTERNRVWPVPHRGVPDGYITSYLWTFEDPLAPGGQVTTNVPNPTYSFLSLGTRKVTLKVCDNDGVCATTTRNVTVTNQKPVAVIAPITNNTVQGLTGAFQGSTSYDPDGTIASYYWEFGDGQTSTQANPTHTYPSYGNKTVRLTVTDNDGATDTQQLAIYVNSLPTASFVSSKPFGYFTSDLPLHLDLDGSASWDADGSVVRWDWSYNPPIDGFGSPGPLATVDYDQEVHRGVQYVTLTVTDDRGGTAVYTRHVATINQRPIPVPTAAPCSFTYTQGAATTGCVLNNQPYTVNFTGSGSTDPDGTISRYEWDFDGNGTVDSTAANPSFTYPNTPQQTYKPKLTVYDNWNIGASATLNVRLNRAPTATWSAPNTNFLGVVNVRRNVAVTFDGSGSSDPDANALPAPASPNLTYTWTWTVPAGAQAPTVNLANPAKPAFTFPTITTALAPYTVTLVVTDGDGKVSSGFTRAVDSSNAPPTAAFSIDGQVGSPFKCNATFFKPCNPAQPNDANATPNFAPPFSAAASSDPDGTIVDWSWNFGDGSPVVTGTATPSKTYTTYGTYTITLTVTDNGGATATTTKTIKINRTPVATLAPLASSYSTPQSVTFTIAASDADNGGPLSPTAYGWSIDVGGSVYPILGTSSSRTFVASELTPGTHTIKATATDADGGITNMITTIRINQRPVAIIATPTQPSGQRTMNTEPYTVPNFTSTGSNDPDGTIASYLWDFGDGTTSTAANPGAKVYATSGTYTVSLTVTDNEGITNTVTTSSTITVKANASAVPIITPTTLDPKRGLAFTFDGTTSTDADGTIPNTTLGYRWTFTGSPTIDLTNPSKPKVTWATNGTYTVTLQVQDNDLRLSTTTASRTFNVTTNVKPTASFTTNPSPASGAADPLPISVNGSGSSDADGSIVSWAWDWGDGAQTTGVNSSHNYTAFGNFTITLTVTDNSGETATTTKSVRHNRKPVITVNTTPSPAVFNDPPWNVRLDATGTIDPDGTIVSYSWDFADGSPLGTTVSVNHTYTARGTYNVVLTVTDNEGGVSTRTIPVKVNRQPTAVASFTPSDAPRLLPVTFDGLGSYDTDGTIVNWEWDFGDGSTGNGSSVEHTFIGLDSNPLTPLVNDPYSVKLTVTDNDGGIDVQTIQVQTTNQAPVAVIFTNPSPAVGDPGLSVRVDGAASYDPDGTLVSYEWDYGDGSPIATGYQPPAHVFPNAYGTYTVTLTVTDNTGAQAVTSVPVKINRPPTGSISPATPTRGIPYGFSGSGSDADGSVVAYRWDFNDGPGAISTAQNPTYTYQSFGSKTVTLTITDNDGRTSIISRTITVAQQGPSASFAAVSDTSTPAVLSGAAPMVISVDGSGSSDPDNSLDSNPGQVIKTYAWDWGDGSPVTSGSSATASHTYSGSPGAKTLRLTVTDTDDATATITKTITIVTNSAPTASFTRTPSSGGRPLSVFFDASASSDSDGRIASYSWDFGDGSTATGVTASHTYGSGQWVATLTVRDNSNAPATTTRTISVGGTLQPPTGLRHTGGSANFAWDPVPGATKYTITITDQGYNSAGGLFCGSAAATQSFDAPATTGYIDVCGGRDILFNITAWNGSEQGPPSNAVSGAT